MKIVTHSSRSAHLHWDQISLVRALLLIRGEIFVSEAHSVLGAGGGNRETSTCVITYLTRGQPLRTGNPRARQRTATSTPLW